MPEFLLVKVGFLAAAAREDAAADFANMIARALAGDGSIRVTGERPNEPVPASGRTFLRYAQQDADVFELPSPFTAQVSLTAKALAELDPDRGAATTGMDFALAYDGELFATASSDLARGDAGIPCRRLLERAVKQEGRLTPFVVGPSPIHPDIHLKVTRGDEFFEVTDWEYDRARDILTIGVTTASEHTTEGILAAFLGEISSTLISFYELQCSRSAVDEAYGTAVGSFQELHEVENGRQRIPMWRLIKASQARRAAWRLISDVHRALAEHALRDSTVANEARDFREHLKRLPWLAELESYFEGMVAGQSVRYEVLLAGVESLRAALLTQSQNRAIIWSGLVGVVLGALAGAAVQKAFLSSNAEERAVHQANPAAIQTRTGPNMRGSPPVRAPNDAGEANTSGK